MEIESYLQPQRQVSVKNVSAPCLTASLHFGPYKGSLGKAGNTTQSCPRWSGVLTPRQGLYPDGDGVEEVSQRPSMAMSSQKTVSNSAVERHCGFLIKAK